MRCMRWYSIYFFSQASSGFGGFGQLSAPSRDAPVTAEKSGNVNLYRSQQSVSTLRPSFKMKRDRILSGLKFDGILCIDAPHVAQKCGSHMLYILGIGRQLLFSKHTRDVRCWILFINVHSVEHTINFKFYLQTLPFSEIHGQWNIDKQQWGC